MTVKRLREKYSDEELAQIYSVPHDSSHWQDHNIRVAESIAFINENTSELGTAADLSCGDGRILTGVNAQKRIYGDYAGGYQYSGPLEETINQISKVDLFICSETLEHLDDPIAALKLVRLKTRELFISTPVGRFDDNNHEHYWAWDFDGISSVLKSAGFDVVASKVLYLSQQYYYDFQLVLAV